MFILYIQSTQFLKGVWNAKYFEIYLIVVLQ